MYRGFINTHYTSSNIKLLEVWEDYSVHDAAVTEHQFKIFSEVTRKSKAFRNTYKPS